MLVKISTQMVSGFWKMAARALQSTSWLWAIGYGSKHVPGISYLVIEEQRKKEGPFVQ